MFLGRVVGSVWGGKEAASLGVNKLALVRPVAFPAHGPVVAVEADGADQPLTPALKIALDQLGAGIGEYVLVGHGSRIRDLTVGPFLPTKDVLVAIVDSCHVDPALFPDADTGTPDASGVTP
jgi:microcompartment protein CcmK/EutM